MILYTVRFKFIIFTENFISGLLGEDNFYTIGASNFVVYYLNSVYPVNSTKWFDGTPFNYSNFYPGSSLF